MWTSAATYGNRNGWNSKVEAVVVNLECRKVEAVAVNLECRKVEAVAVNLECRKVEAVAVNLEFSYPPRGPESQ